MDELPTSLPPNFFLRGTESEVNHSSILKFLPQVPLDR